MSGSMPPPPPPPRHHARLAETKSTTASSSTVTTDATTGEKQTWRQSLKARSAAWGSGAYTKGISWSDKIGGRVNVVAEKIGTERFWPTTGDFPQELEKAARILRAFTVDGLETTVEKDVVEEGSGKKTKKRLKVHRKIPPAVIRQARGLAIFTSMRSGIMPFGGAGGTGIVIARLEDGSWSPPAGFMPNNLSTGFMIGVDVYDCVMVINDDTALEKFFTHKATVGTDVAVVAGPLGAGGAVESGLERAPAYSYIRSRGLYAGVQLVGQVFIDRIDENAAVYHWPGVKAGDILTGKVRYMPREATPLLEALADAETGKAQTEKGEELDVYEAASTAIEAQALVLGEGEVLKLPPTPDAVSPDLGDGDPEVEKVHYEPESLVNSRRGSVVGKSSELGGSGARTPDLGAGTSTLSSIPPKLPARRRPVPPPPPPPPAAAPPVTTDAAATLPPYMPSDAPAAVVGIGLDPVDSHDDDDKQVKESSSSPSSSSLRPSSLHEIERAAAELPPASTTSTTTTPVVRDRDIDMTTGDFPNAAGAGAAEEDDDFHDAQEVLPIVAVAGAVSKQHEESSEDLR